MRSVVVAGVVKAGHAIVVWRWGGDGAELQALRRVGLMPAHQALQKVVAGGENIPHIVKQREAETFPQIRQADRRKAEFLTVDEQCRAPAGETGIGIISG